MTRWLGGHAETWVLPATTLVCVSVLGLSGLEIDKKEGDILRKVQ